MTVRVASSSKNIQSFKVTAFADSSSDEDTSTTIGSSVDGGSLQRGLDAAAAELDWSSFRLEGA